MVAHSGGGGLVEIRGSRRDDRPKDASMPTFTRRGSTLLKRLTVVTIMALWPFAFAACGHEHRAASEPAVSIARSLGQLPGIAGCVATSGVARAQGCTA